MLIRGGVSILWQTFDAKEAAVLQINPDFMESFGGKLVMVLSWNPTYLLHGFSAHNYDIICSRSTHCPPYMYSAPLKCFVAHSDKRWPVSKSFFTHSSKCYSSSFSITWSFLSTPAQFHLSAVAYLSRIHAPTLGIVAASGTLFGAVLPPFFHVLGWLFIRICRVLNRGRQRIVFKGGYGIHFSHRQTSPSAVRMCFACTRVGSSLGNPTIPESSRNSSW